MKKLSQVVLSFMTKLSQAFLYYLSQTIFYFSYSFSRLNSVKKLSHVVSYFNMGRSHKNPCLCSLLVRHMGNGNWEARLMNVFYLKSKEPLPVALVGNGRTGEEAVSSLIAVLASDNVFRLPQRAKPGKPDIEGLNLEALSQPVENDLYKGKTALATASA